MDSKRELYTDSDKLQEECGVFGIYDFDGNERVVDNHIKKLRTALGSCGCTIHTVPKAGYRLEMDTVL